MEEPLATAESASQAKEQAMSDKSHDPNQMTGAAMIVRALIDHGIQHIFGYPGGAVLPIYDEIFQQSEVEHILVRHEQGAGHAAEGYARSTGKPGVVLVTSGPGATNMVTPLTDALMDSIPLVCITGQVPTHLIGNDAFQECDTVGITRPCTKHNWLVRDVNDLAKVLRQLVEVTGFPITSTLMGLGAYPASGKNWLGMLGMHGTYEANMTMHDCDVMLCVGARFDDRITGRVDAFSPASKKIHIDIDPSSIHKNIRVEAPHRWMTSGGLGTMGYGLPAALGVQVAHPDSLVIDIAGDASVQMTIQEMSTAVQHELPIKIFILNNQYMGMVRQWQQLLHG